MDFSSLNQTMRDSYLFSELTEAQADELLAIATEHSVDTGARIIHEGEEDHYILILTSGTVNVVKTSDSGEHVLAAIEGVEVLGEFTIFDYEPRSTSVDAATAVTYLRVSVDDLRSSDHSGLYSAMLRICGSHIVHRLRDTNQTTTDALEQKLAESNAKNAIGVFFVYIVSSLALYTLALRHIVDYKYMVPGGTRTVTVALLFTLAPICIFAIKRTPYPFSKFGLTTEGWKPAVIEAVKWSAVALVGITLAKWAVLVSNGSDAPLFSPFGNYYRDGVFNLTFYLGAFVAYTLTCPLQELIVRGSLQSCLHHVLTGSPSRVAWTSIIVSNLIFAMCHSHIRLTFALAAFIPGLLWGWLYSRNMTLIGPVLSHLIIGIYFLFILGTGGLV